VSLPSGQPAMPAGLLAEAVDVSRAGLRTDLNFARSVLVYRSLFDDLASPQRLGLSEEDLITAWSSGEAVTATYRVVGDQQVDLPLLVPIEHLYWYNADFFRSVFGPRRAVHYFTHAPVSLEDDRSLALISSELERGSVLVTDSYATVDISNEFDDWAARLGHRGMKNVNVETLRGSDADGILHQFVGNVDFQSRREFARAPSCVDQFREASRLGLIQGSIEDGIEVVEEISDREAERLWEIYEGPFDALSGGHALRAGFEEQAFLEAMKSRDVIKVLRRWRGEITTLCLVVTDLGECTWLNASFYEEHYREAYDTRNILVFPGIVSDEALRGAAHGPELIRLLTEVLGMRGTSIVITFECNGISSQYIPQIVERAVARATSASVSGLERPVSRVGFKTISKAT
jgi:hypothetical protein